MTTTEEDIDLLGRAGCGAGAGVNGETKLSKINMIAGEFMRTKAALKNAGHAGRRPTREKLPPGARRIASNEAEPAAG